MDEIIASLDKGGYDPFLCAQDIPGEFAIEKAVVSGDQASVVVHEIWNPGTQYESIHDVKVALRSVIGSIKPKGRSAHPGESRTQNELGYS